MRFYGLVFLVLFCIEGSLLYVLYSQLYNQDDITVKNQISKDVSQISNNYILVYDTLAYSLKRTGNYFQTQPGVFLTPYQFNTLLAFNTSVLFDALPAQRWLPHINRAQRASYEAFYRQYYDANFSIRTIHFVGAVAVFEPIPVKDNYYPLTLQYPPFTLTVMGGDFLDPTSIAYARFVMGLNITNIGAGSPIHVVTRPANDNAIYLSYVVHENSSDYIVGVAQALFVPSVVVSVAMRINNLARSSYSVYITEAATGAIVYSDGTITDTSYSITKTIHIADKDYIHLYVPSSSYVSSKRSVIPEYVLIFGSIIVVLLTMIICTILIYYNIVRQADIVYRSMLGYVNHELRNLLQGISLVIQMTLQNLDAGDVEMNQDLNIGMQYCGLMTHVVNDILDLRSLDEGMKIDLVNIDITDFLAEIHKLVAPLCVKPDVAFVVENHSVGLMIHSDRYRITQVLLNFLTNAIKYTDAGTVTLIVEHIGSAAHSAVKFSVRDTGVGIPDGNRGNLFKPFLQNISGNTRRNGTGLGLYLAYKMVKLLNRGLMVILVLIV